VYTEDCQGCGVCIETCPTKVKSLEFSPINVEREHGEREFAEFFDSVADDVIDGIGLNTVKGMQFKKPLFEFSGACAGCGETPYVKLVSQICGERMLAANATGCSSIYGGTFPTTPYAQRRDGRGPAWGNSLFEDNAEYGLGMRLAVDSNRRLLKSVVDRLLTLGTTEALTSALKKNADLWGDRSEAGIDAQKATQVLLDEAYEKASNEEAKVAIKKLIELKDYFTDKDVWIIGGDGWAYDIGFGGVDHVVASGKNVNILVLDTEVYSNTGGQASKATPIGAVAKFANAGKQIGKKNMGFMMMSYGHAYVASISMGANRLHTQKALQEAVEFDGPSIVFCYAPCINHGINMMKSQVEEKRAVDVGYWPLFRYNPTLEEGKRFSWDAKAQDGDFQEFIKSERRYSSLYKTNPENADALFAKAEEDAKRRMEFYKSVGQIM
jgi:pyruvate-ferredoxin/flavodoxin oxidoreductase